MSIKKIILFSLLAIAGIVAIYYLAQRSANNQANVNVFQAIPEDADGIAVINVEAFMSLFFSNLGDVWELKDEFEGNQNTEDFNKEMQLSGINLTRKIVFYMTDNQFNLLVPISSQEKFKDYIQNLEGQAAKDLGNNQYYSSELGGFLGFNENICYVSQCSADDVELAKAKWNAIQSSEAEDKPLSAEISDLAESEEHFSFFMKEDEMAERSPYFDHSPASKSVLTFEDGLIRIKSTLSSSQKEIKNPLISGGQSLVNSDYLNFHLNIDPSANWSYWLSEAGEIELRNRAKELGLTEEFINSWEGNFNLALSGIETVEEEVVSYEYDDNFNKVETKKLSEVKKIGYQMSYTGAQTDFSLKGLEFMGIGSGLFTSEDNTQFYTSNGQTPQVSNENNSAISLKLNPSNIIQLAMDQGFGLAVLGQSYADIFDEITISSIPNGETIESETIISLADKEKNSLIYLIGALQKGR